MLLVAPMPEILPLVISVIIIVTVYLFSAKQNKNMRVNNLALESEVIKYKELLQYAEEKKDTSIKDAEKQAIAHRQLMAKLCRDIRTSMNTVEGMHQLLSQAELSSEQYEMIKAMSEGSQQVLQIINEAAKGDGKEYLKAGATYAQRTSAPAVAARETKTAFTTEFAQAYPLKILVAEDDEINRHIAAKIFSKLGYKPDIVQNGKEALEIVGDKHYDIVFMDIVMPEMDGFEATRMIRLCLDTQPVIIAMTASALDGDQEKCVQAGMNDYISKPVLLDQLVKMLEKWAIKEKAAVTV